MRPGLWRLSSADIISREFCAITCWRGMNAVAILLRSLTPALARTDVLGLTQAEAIRKVGDLYCRTRLTLFALQRR